MGVANPGGIVRTPVPHSVLFAFIFPVAFATLLLEVSLIRVLSFTIWYHFAYVVLSTALLGFGASGTLLAVRPAIGTRRPRATLARCATAAALATLGALLFIVLVPLHPTEILEDWRQLAVLVAYQIVATVPFFFAGAAVSLALRDAALVVDRLYFWDLLGAGTACVTAIAILNAISPPGGVVLAAAIFLAAAVVVARGRGTRLTAAAGALATLLLIPAAAEAPFTIAHSKELSMLTHAIGARPLRHHWSALYRSDLSEHPKFGTGTERCTDWGLSKTRAPAFCDPARLYISHDGTAGTGVYDLGHGTHLPELDAHVLRLPYLVATPHARVLVIGVGGGRDLVVARQFGAAHVTGVELDPVAVRWIRDELDAVTHGFFRDPAVTLVVGEGRHAVEATDETFDVIQLTGVDTLSAEFSGAYVLAENYLYTLEAMGTYLDHLNPGGILSFATGNGDREAPRAAGRMLSTARRALLERGVAEPERHVALIDSDAVYVEVMIRREPFTPTQVAALRAEAERLGFIPLYLPDGSGLPLYRALATTGGAARARLLAGQRFLIDEVTDDRPFFFSFFRWTELFKRGGGTIGPSHVTALGQIVLLILLVTMSLLGGLLILVPLALFRRRGLVVAGRPALGILAYFVALGTGFMMFEISLIQRFVLFLGYPTYSLTATLGSLLVSLGCGSWLSRRWVGREHVALPLAVAALALLTAWYVLGMPALQERLLGAPLSVRVAVTACMLGPLGLVMGVFFPLGIRRAVALHEDLVPWAWGINGCASVTAAVLAVVLAMTYGVTAVWLLSLAVYAAGTLAFLTLTRARP